MNILQLTNKLKVFLNTRIDNIANTNPIVGFFKPVIIKTIDNKIGTFDKYIKMVSDEEGNIDENMLSELIDKVKTTSPFSINTKYFGDIEIGAGAIRMNIPMLNDKKIAFDTNDLEDLKTLLTYKEG